MKSKFTKTLVALFVFIISFVNIVKAANNLPPTSVDQSEINKLSTMSLHELQDVAKPMQQGCIDQIVSGSDTIEKLKSYLYIPNDGNIYYIQYNLGSNTYVTYYKFLYVTLSEYPYVIYHVYYWSYNNSTPLNNGLAQDDEKLGGLYNDIKDELAKDTITQNLPYKTYRYSSILDIANSYSSSTLDNIVISTGFDFADSLSGAALASKLKAPILFVNTSNDDNTFNYVNNNLKKHGTIYILGKEGAVSIDIEDKFKSYDFNVIRLGGADRYETCNIINNQLSVKQGTPVIIVNGDNFPDAVSASSIATIKGYPILLTQKDVIPDNITIQLRNIKPSSIYIVGGPGVISNSIIDKLQLYSDNVTRIYGSDRYETSINVCKYFNIDSNTILLASGNDFKNALSGSVLAAKLNAPLILIDSNIEKVKLFLDSSKYRNLIILGDTDSISNDSENALTK